VEPPKSCKVNLTGARLKAPSPLVHHTPLHKLAAASIFSVGLALTAHAQTAITVDNTKTVRVVDPRMFGVNTAVWDGAFTDSQTLTTLQTVNPRFLRYPGGSSADDYHWQTNTAALEGGSAGTTNFDAFATYAKAIGAQVVITANYGTGTPAEAAAWVTYSNITKGYGFKYWEVGNECYGTWEDDNNSPTHNGVEYATRAAQYIQAMKAADPSIKVGVVGDSSEDSYSNGYTTSVTNPVTKVSHIGFTPLMLSTLKSLGVTPDFLIYHNYAQNSGQENDAQLLQYAPSWTMIAANLRMQLTDYLGAAGANVELLNTENNSVSSGPGKQTTSLVNGLYYADSLGSLMQTEFNSLVWWALHNGPGTTGNNSAALYGWRLYGDYGIENGDNTNAGNSIFVPTHDPYPVYYVQKLLTHFARGGDTVVTASSNNALLTPYAVKRQDGSLSLLVINKSPTATLPANFTLTGFTPVANATVYSYGIPQDEYSEENAPTSTAPATGYSWENTLDGWVNQSGQPDTTATNYGLDAPFLYSLAYSQTTGVTSGGYSLACTTTAANPGDSAVIQNSSASLGTALTTAASVSLDIFPQVASGTTVQASIYINGTNIPYALLATVNLNANQENTANFPLTDAQRSGIQASLVSGAYFQVGININSPVPLTVYFDNFTITPLVAPTPTPTPTPIAGAASSPDVAVSAISNAGPTFSASFGPYSATVISLTENLQIVSQPTERFTSVGGSATFSVTAGGPAPYSYQWNFNGNPIAGATGSSYTVSNAQTADAGAYTVTVTSGAHSVTSQAANLMVNSGSAGTRLINISTRAMVGTGANILIPGFVVTGTGTETLLIRADGPSLTGFGVGGVLAQPTLSVYSGSTVIASNTGWGTNSNPALIASTAAQVGAFSLASGSADCAVIVSLGAGPYTVQISGVNGTTGVALAEIYEVSSSGTRLANISTRANVGTGGNILIPGFVISGPGTEELLVRADGPSLTQFSVSGVLAQTILGVYSGSTLVASNTGWSTSSDPSEIAGIAASVGAFAFVSGSGDSAQIVSLGAGPYTVQISGVNNTTGVALAEIYEVQ
jgi:Ig-like domain-containing protein